MPILLLGDSHTDPFLHQPDVIRFDLRQCQPVLFTTHRFTDINDTNLHQKLDIWLTSLTTQSTDPAKTLVITSGEIDIRAHYWRHIPREYLSINDIIEFVRKKAYLFYVKLEETFKKYNLNNIVVWGSPVAGEKAQYNSEHPYGGSSVTRNILTHIWNREFGRFIHDKKHISLATAFYNFINHENYSTLDPNPSHDGVHWHDSFGSTFWNQIVLPATHKGGLFVGENWTKMVNHEFDIREQVSSGTQQYDTWARADQYTDVSDIHHHVFIKGNTYSWISSHQRSKLPVEYIELCLQKR